MLRFVACFLLLATALRAWAGPDDDFVEIYQLIQQTDHQREAGRLNEARRGYERAQENLRQLRKDHPEWNERVVTYRLRYVAEKLALLPAEPVTTTNAPPAAASPAGGTAPAAPTGEVLTEFRQLNDQIGRLQSEKQLLEARLREALTAQPVPVDPRELQAAVARITQLQSTNQLLIERLESQQAERRSLVDRVLVEEAEKALAEANAKLADQRDKTVEMERLRQLAEGELRRIQSENTALRVQVTTLGSDIDRGDQLANLTERLARLQVGLDEARRDNEGLLAERADLQRELEALRARQNEEGSLRIHQLETDLALARADADRSATRAEELSDQLDAAQASRIVLAKENQELTQRVQGLTQELASLPDLEAQLTAEQEERKEIETQLRVAEARLLATRATEASRATGAAGTSGTGDPSDSVQVRLLETEVTRLRDSLRQGRDRQTELMGLLTEAQRARVRLEQEKKDLEIALAAAQKTPTAREQAQQERTVRRLNETVQRLERERDELTRRLAAGTDRSRQGLQVARRERLGIPREDAMRFRLERRR